MLPAPSTTATSTPRSRTALSCSAIPCTVSASVPYSSGPIRASPESLIRTRLNLEDAQLGVLGVLRDVVVRDVLRLRRRRDVHRDLAGEPDEVLVARHEV